MPGPTITAKRCAGIYNRWGFAVCAPYTGPSSCTSDAGCNIARYVLCRICPIVCMILFVEPSQSVVNNSKVVPRSGCGHFSKPCYKMCSGHMFATYYMVQLIKVIIICIYIYIYRERERYTYICIYIYIYTHTYYIIHTLYIIYI